MRSVLGRKLSNKDDFDRRFDKTCRYFRGRTFLKKYNVFATQLDTRTSNPGSVFEPTL